MTESRRFSQAISEGDGISVIVGVADLDAARDAELERAEGIVLSGEVAGIREAISLPILWQASGSFAEARRCGADACLLVVAHFDGDGDRLEQLSAEAAGLGLECVVEVADAEELELALERIDPEIFLLSARAAEQPDSLERVLELLPDVPAGKLAIADADVATRAEIDELERAGFDAVIVRARNVAGLVGASPPEV